MLDRNILGTYTVVKLGGSLAVVICDEFAKRNNLKAGDMMLQFESVDNNKEIIMTPRKPQPDRVQGAHHNVSN